jgi:predicted anti-sigma-YlaC factor YlaD
MIGDSFDRARTASRCARAHEWVSLRVDAELSELERLLLRRHLSRCAACREFAAGVEATTRAIRTSERAAPAHRVSLADLSEPVRRRPIAGVRPRVVVALVTLAAAAGALVGVLVTGGDGSQPGPAPLITGPDLAQAPQPPPPPDEPRPA